MFLTEAPLHQPASEQALPCADAFNRYAPPVARLMQSLPQSVFAKGHYSGLMAPPTHSDKFKQWVTLEGCRCFVKSTWSNSEHETNTVIYEKLTADIAADLGFANASAAFLPERYSAQHYKSLSFLSVDPSKAALRSMTCFMARPMENRQILTLF